MSPLPPVLPSSCLCRCALAKLHLCALEWQVAGNHWRVNNGVDWDVKVVAEESMHRLGLWKIGLFAKIVFLTP